MRVLIVGSLAGELGEAGRIAIGRGAQLVQADDVAAGLARLRGHAVDLVLMDVALDVGGLIAAMVSERIIVPVVACGVDADAAAAVRAVRAGAREFLPLPPDPELIAALLHAASAERHSLVIRDPAMAACVQRAEQVAAAEASILITGETGTGKEVLARHIHRRSRRSHGPFVAVNCAAIPANLLESELFGHEKGAFTGAVARRIGRFEAAEGGTLLLDEIGDLDLALQAKLLRIVQEREIDRLGGSAPVRVDVRILAATHRDLAAAAAAGIFREDLLFRLNVVTIRIPPLRERPGDIAALAEHFVRRYADVNAMPYRPLGLPARQKLLGHRWRGNVRELENVIHRAVLLEAGSEIGADAIELPEADTQHPGDQAPYAAARTGGQFSGHPGTQMGHGSQTHTQAGREAHAASVAGTAAAIGSLRGLVGRSMADVERELILSTVRHTLGNRTHAATILGISIRALRNKLRDYATAGVPVPPPPAGTVAALQGGPSDGPAL